MCTEEPCILINYLCYEDQTQPVKYNTRQKYWQEEERHNMTNSEKKIHNGMYFWEKKSFTEREIKE